MRMDKPLNTIQRTSFVFSAVKFAPTKQRLEISCGSRAREHKINTNTAIFECEAKSDGSLCGIKGVRFPRDLRILGVILPAFLLHRSLLPPALQLILRDSLVNRVRVNGLNNFIKNRVWCLCV